MLTGLFPYKYKLSSGIFITRRMKQLQKFNISYKVFYFNIIEQGLYKVYKKTYSIPLNNENRVTEYDGVYYSYINIPSGLVDKIYPAKRLIQRMADALLDEIKDENFDVIHAHWVYPEGAVAIKLKEVLNIPCVINAHGSDIRRFPYIYPGRIAQTLAVLDNADMIFFTDNNMVNSARDLGFLGCNFMVTPTVGVDTIFFSHMDKKNIEELLHIKDKRVKKVGFIGNLYKEKGADFLPKVFLNVLADYPSVEFFVIGDGYLRSKIEKNCIRNGLPVHFIGRVSPERIPLWMNALDVVVLPSRSEGMPNVPLEAQACGCPVVGSDVGGIPEALGFGSVVVKFGERFEERFAAAIVGILRVPPDPLKVRESVLRYDCEVVVKRQIQAYERLING